MNLRPATRLTAALLIWGVGGLTSCRRSPPPSAAPPPPRLGPVQIRDVSPAASSRPDALDPDAIARVARGALLASHLFADGDPDAGHPAGPLVRVRGDVGVEFAEVDRKGVVRAAVSLKIDTRPSDAPGAIEDELSAAGEQIYPITAKTDRAALAERLAERTVADLLDGFLTRVHLRTASPAEIHGLISLDAGQPSDLRQEAIRTAGERRLRGEVPALLALLQDDDEGIRDAALGALIAMHERRAVGVLARSRSLRDRHEMRKILDAIATLGGEEAKEYLSFVADSHDDEEIRKLAADAKARLDRRPGP